MRTEITQLKELSGACGVAAAELGPTAGLAGAARQE